MGIEYLFLLPFLSVISWFRQHHPILGILTLCLLIYVILMLLVWWWKRTFHNGMFIRKEPYRRIQLDEENIKFNPMNEQTPIQKGNDEKHS